MENDFIKYLEEIKDQKSSIEIRLIDNKHNKICYKTLTYKELFLINAAGIEIQWEDIGKDK